MNDSSLEAAYDKVPVTEETFELSPDEYADVFAATRGTGYSGNSVVFVTRDGTDFPELSDSEPDRRPATPATGSCWCGPRR